MTKKTIISAILLACFALPLKAELTQEVVDSMFIIASSGAQKYRDQVQPTIQDMADYNAEIVPFLIEKLNTIDGRERTTLEQIFRKIKDPAIPLLNDALLTETDSLRLSRVALILFYLPDSSSVENLLTVVNHDFYWLRYQALRALGRIGDYKGKDAVVNALKDNNELVRTMAAVSCGRMIKDKELFDVLLPVLDDPYYGVRFSAMESIKGLACEVKQDYIFNFLEMASDGFPRAYLSLVLAEDTCLYDTEVLKQSANYLRYGDLLKALWKSDCLTAIEYGRLTVDKIVDADKSAALKKEYDRLLLEYLPCEEKETPTDSR